MSYYKDTLKEFAEHGGGGWILLRDHVPEKVREWGDRIRCRFMGELRLRVENERLRREVDGLRNDIDRLTDALEPSLPVRLPEKR